MEISMADQIALDDALVAPDNRLKIGKCNLRLSSDVTSKEATLQVVYDVLKLTPFYKAFQVSADVPEIYMQEFWASAYIHNRSVRFKMNNKKHILNLDQFRDILQICPKVGNKKFEEPPLEKEILAFLASLGHSGEIRKITDVNVNKLHQPWRSFAAIINKCLSEDFTYQIETRYTKKGQCYVLSHFTKLIVDLYGYMNPSIPRRNKVNWLYARDDPMFTKINVILRNEDTQLYGAILPAELTNEDIRNSESYKEYYAIALGKIPSKTKASKKKANSDAPTKQKSPTVPKEKKGKKTGKGKQKAKELETIFEATLTEAESGANEGTGVSPGVPDAPKYDSDDDISWKSSEDDQDDDKNDDDENAQDDEDDDKNDDDKNAQDDDDEAQSKSEDDGDDFIHPKLTTHDDETTHEKEIDEDDTFDPIVHTPSYVSSLDDEDSDNEVEEKSRDEDCYIYVVLPQVQVTHEIEDTHVTLTLVNPDGQQQSSSVSSGFEAKTSHAVAANLLELELKTILIDKMEANKSINKSNIQRQLYKALVDAPRDGADDDQEPSAGTDRGSKRRRSGKEPESTSAPREKTTTTAGKTTTGSKTHKHSASQSAPVEETMKSTDVFEAPAHQEFETGPTFELMKGTCKSLTELEYFCEEVYKATTEKLDWTNPEGRQYPHDLRKPLPLVPNSQGRHVIPFHHFINNDLEYLRGGESSRKYSTSGISHWGKKRRQFYAFATTRESARDVYSKRRIIAVTKVEIVEWQNYKHLDWITVRRDDDILYKFKEGDLHRLRIQDIEDMLLLLVQGKLTNLNVEERLAFNVSLRMFTRSVVIQRRVEDLQLGVESYQKKLNLTKPDTYRSNLRRRDAYTPYSDPRGFIYENKDKKNRLMRIDELHKFSDGTLDDVRTALNDRLKGIRMEYLPQTFWSQRDKANARAMVQAIDKRLKTRRIMRSLERFVGGRPYGGDLRLLQRTI
ncbi:hypothetical protein Tco_0014274 [Tanacetum coccineum]